MLKMKFLLLINFAYFLCNLIGSRLVFAEIPEKGLRVKCAEISDQFCSKIWNPPYNGNMDLGSSQLWLGKTSRSEMSKAQEMDLKALIMARKQLPTDFRNKVRPVLRELEVVLKNEKDDDLWYRSLIRIEQKLQDVEFETALMRVQKRIPSFSRTLPKDRNYDDNFEFKKDFYDLRAQIIRAKYENTEPWKKVAGLFEKVRNWVEEEVHKFPVDELNKRRMIAKIKAIRLQFPTEDPRIMSVENGCGSVLINAFYMPNRNSLTVCAGWFNVLRDNAASILVLAHEMAHAIDPISRANDLLMETEMGGVFKQLCEAKGPIFSCDKWQDIKQKVFTTLNEITFLPLGFAIAQGLFGVPLI